MKRVALPCGATARVSDNVSPETLNALDELMRAAMRVFPYIRRCEECEDPVDEVRFNTLVDCPVCAAKVCVPCHDEHMLGHHLDALASEEGQEFLERHYGV